MIDPLHSNLIDPPLGMEHDQLVQTGERASLFPQTSEDRSCFMGALDLCFNEMKYLDCFVFDELDQTESLPLI